MSKEAWGDPPDPEPQMCPLCGGEYHAEGCELGEEVSRRLKAERDAHRMQFALRRLWPALERAMAGLVFTADRAGDVAADMSTIRAAIVPEETAPGCKTPAGCRENGCLGWCDEHKPEVATRCDGCAELRDQLREKAAWCDELERDAERYRFVRTADKVGISAEAARDPVAYDAAIDRAMERAKL